MAIAPLGMTKVVHGTTLPRSILVVEDEYSIRTLLQEGLSDEGFDVSTVASAEDALRLIDRRRPDVVLLDLVLPGMNGLDLAREIRTRYPVFIIAMSASTRKLQDARCSSFVDSAIPKPFEWDNLLADLHKAVA